MIRSFAVSVLLTAFALPGLAQAQSRVSDEHVDKGDYLFKTGYYLKASEHYRLALLDDPASPWKKLAFGHALFAIGNYSYASYALRRAVADLDDGAFQPEIATLFPSRRAFTQALRDLKRYVTYSPRDPAGLTILGYVLYTVPGEERRCRDMFLYLSRLDPKDPFAAFFLKRLSARGKLPRDNGDVIPLRPPPKPPVETPERVAPPAPIPNVPPAPTPPALPTPKPSAEAKKKARRDFPPIKDVVPPPTRHSERVLQEWPSPVPALAD
jgi:tetratricopeptide (TPR) repeat protein